MNLEQNSNKNRLVWMILRLEQHVSRAEFKPTRKQETAAEVELLEVQERGLR